MARKLSDITGSIGTKLSLILLAITATIVSGLVAGYLAKTRILASVEKLAQENVPGVRESTKLAIDFGDLRAELIDYLLAVSPEELDEHHGHFAEFIAGARADLAASNPRLVTQIDPLITAIEQQMAIPVAARHVEFDRMAEVNAAITELYALGQKANALLAKRTGASTLAIQMGGQKTTGAVRATLDRLTNVDFAALRITLELRSELNLLTGIALAMSAAPPIDLAEILRDVGLGSLDRLNAIIPKLLTVPGMGAHIADINQAQTVFSAILKGGLPQAAKNRGAVLSLRQSIDNLLSTLLDEITFDLTIAAEEASDANAQSIKKLLEGEVAGMQNLTQLSLAIKNLIVAALEVRMTTDIAALEPQQISIQKMAANITAMAAQSDPEVIKTIAKLSVIADPEKGIIALQRTLLTTQADAKAKIWAAKDFVTESVMQLYAVSVSELDGIDAGSAAIVAEIDRTQQIMAVIMAISIATAAAAPFVAYFLIVRPLGAAARATTALAAGDLTVVDKLKASSGEVGMLVRALRVFRDGLIDKARLEQEERANAAARAQAEQRAADERRAQQAREQTLIAEQERAQRTLQAAEEAKREALRLAAEQERLERLAVQNAVVSSLAGGLRKLSAGDLRAQIRDPFAEGYDQLRLDFNAAVSTLEELISSIRRSVDSIHGGSGEISHAAADLSRRTEQTAATLEQSAAALTELTASVESAADGAADAARIVESARANAERSDGVVREAVTAMGAIEDSSRKISTIIGVIDDIAFQTNLLALNAGVEAARAGDAGRGFAVVASEVRALSQRSSDAAREIGTLISESGRQVNRGVGLVGQAGEALRAIVQSVTEISHHVSTIAASAREQSTGISEINVAIGQLDQATQQNAAMVEQTTAASLTLTDEASILAETVSRFSTGEGGEHPAQDTRAQWLQAS